MKTETEDTPIRTMEDTINMDVSDKMSITELDWAGPEYVQQQNVRTTEISSSIKAGHFSLSVLSMSEETACR
jgi:hypothetical protein